MINATTTTKLQEMKLRIMAESFNQQIHDHAFSTLTFEERFGLIVDSEWNQRKNNKLAPLASSGWIFGYQRQY